MLKCSAVIQFPCVLLRCVLRFVGQSEWFIADRRGKFNWAFLDHKNTPLEEVNMNYTDINYRGLDNLGKEGFLFLSIQFFFLLYPYFLSLLPRLTHVLPQRCRNLCGLCQYEDVLKWTTGFWPGFTCSRTLWRNWTSLTVHASQQAAWLHSGISS